MNTLIRIVNGGFTILSLARALLHLAGGSFLLLLAVLFAVQAFEQGFWGFVAAWVGFHGLKWILAALSAFTNSFDSH